MSNFETAESILAIFCFLFACLLLVMYFRNEMILKYRLRKLDKCHKKATEMDAGLDWTIAYREFDSLSYDKMLFSLTKWRYSHFYKD